MARCIRCVCPRASTRSAASTLCASALAARIPRIPSPSPRLGALTAGAAALTASLATATSKDQHTPKQIVALAHERVAAVSAGANVSLCLTARGAVYSSGHGQSSCLGHGGPKPERVPRRIEGLAGVRVVHVSAGSRHCLVVDSAGQVYSFGGAAEPTGHPGARAQPVPKRIEALAAVHAVRACAGKSSSTVLDINGAVYTWATGPIWLLGMGQWLPRRRRQVPSAQPLAAFSAKSVVDLVLGDDHALAVTADGDVYSWGGGLAGHRQPAVPLGLAACDWYRGHSAVERTAAVYAPERLEDAPRMLVLRRQPML